MCILYKYKYRKSEEEKRMGRRPLWRRVSAIPAITYFKPAGIPLRELKEVRLSVEEAEAIRLKDLEGLEQEQCAEKMNVSRPTFARVLDSAHRKVTEALIEGKAVRIEGGNYEMAVRRFRCRNEHEWDVASESLVNKPPEACPVCSTADITAVEPFLPDQRPHKRYRHNST